MVQRRSNKKAWEALTQKRDEYRVQAGWFEQSKYSNGASIGGIAAVQNYGAVINNPGGQPFFKDKDGTVVYASKSSPYAYRMAKTKPHTIVIPPTHFMENCQNKNTEKWKSVFLKAWGAVFAGDMEAEKAMEMAAMVIESDIAQAIKDVDLPLSPATIKARQDRYKNKKVPANSGIGKRLVDTGQMVNSVSHKVEKK